MEDLKRELREIRNFVRGINGSLDTIAICLVILTFLECTKTCK